MKRIKILKSLGAIDEIGVPYNYFENEVVEVDDYFAKDWIKHGIAKETDEELTEAKQ